MANYYPAPAFSATTVEASTSLSAPLIKDTATPGAHAAAPDLAFGDLDTGLWESADDVLKFGTGGTERMSLQSTGLSSALVITSTANQALAAASTPGALAATPSIALGDLDTGLWESADDTLKVGTAGVERVSIAAGGVDVVPDFSVATNKFTANATSGNIVAAGTAQCTTLVATANQGVTATAAPGALGAAPTIAFGDLDTGFWESADDTLNVGTAGVTRMQFGSGYLAFTNNTRFQLNANTFEIATSTSSPAAWAGAQTDFALSASATFLRVTLTGPQTLNSMAGGVDGRMVVIMNIDDTDALTLLHDDGATGTAGMRFLCPNSTSYVVPKNGSVTVWYDSTSARWRVIGPVA